MPSSHSVPIEKVRNLGTVSGSWLRAVGIRTRFDLEQVGPVAAFLAVREMRPRVSLNLLWSLHAGLAHQDWRELSDDEKQTLRSEIES